MSQKLDLFTQYLKDSRKSMTSVRKAVFLALIESEPLTMRQLTSKIGTEADRASIYRAIELFEKLNIVHRLQIGWKYKLEISEQFSHHHHHLLCSRCNVIIPIKDHSVLEQALKHIAHLNSFNMTNHQVEIQGLCRDCSSL